MTIEVLTAAEALTSFASGAISLFVAVVEPSAFVLTEVVAVAELATFALTKVVAIAELATLTVAKVAARAIVFSVFSAVFATVDAFKFAVFVTQLDKLAVFFSLFTAVVVEAAVEILAELASFAVLSITLAILRGFYFSAGGAELFDFPVKHLIFAELAIQRTVVELNLRTGA